VDKNKDLADKEKEIAMLKQKLLKAGIRVEL